MRRFTQYIVEARWERVSVPINPSDDSELLTHFGFSQGDTPDSFYYHVTQRSSADAIQRSGELLANKRRLMGRNHTDNSRGRVFLTDRNGVSYWYTKAWNHAYEKTSRTPEIVVLRIPKSVVPQATPDDIGMRDAHAPAYYVTGGFGV